MLPYDYYFFVEFTNKLLCLSLIRFQEGSQSLNLTIQPPTVPERLKEGRYLVVKVGGMDAEERGDQDALGLRVIRWVEGKICTIYCF